MEIITVGLLAVFMVILITHWLTGLSRNYPPCPHRPLPIVGNLLVMISDQRSQYKKWREQCGDIFSVYIGSKMVVVLNGYDLIKEALLKRGDEFSDRPLTSFDTVTGYLSNGVITSSGKLWKEQRTVSLQILRSFGLGKNILAERIQEEVCHYLEHLSGHRGQPLDIRTITNMSTSNIVCAILFGQRFEYSDEIFQSLTKYVDELFRYFYLNSFVEFVPALRFLPGDVFKVRKVKAEMKSLFEIFERLAEKSGCEANSESLTKEYLKEKQRRVLNGEATTMDDRNLRKIVFDLFVGGTETTSTTICWFVLYMLYNTGEQRKIFDEIMENVGSDRQPTIQDRPKLTYLNAAIMETQRLASIAPNAFPHSCPKDVNIKGFTIPKGAFISPNLDSVMFDEKIWGSDVTSFRPERFLDQSGQLKVPEEFIPFSVGRRACIGESMAKAELFLYLSSMCQKFEFLPADPGQLPPMKHTFGLTVVPESFQVRMASRC